MSQGDPDGVRRLGAFAETHSLHYWIYFDPVTRAWAVSLRDESTPRWGVYGYSQFALKEAIEECLKEAAARLGIQAK